MLASIAPQLASGHKRGDLTKQRLESPPGSRFGAPPLKVLGIQPTIYLQWYLCNVVWVQMRRISYAYGTMYMQAVWLNLKQRSRQYRYALTPLASERLAVRFEDKSLISFPRTDTSLNPRLLSRRSPAKESTGDRTETRSRSHSRSMGSPFICSLYHCAQLDLEMSTDKRLRWREFVEVVHMYPNI